MWFWLIVYGVVITFLIWIVQRKRSWNFRFIMACGVVIVLIIVFFIQQNLEPISLGDTAWYNNSPYPIIIFALLMLLGMAVRTFSKAIEDRREKVIDVRKEGKEKGKTEKQIKAKIKEISLEIDKYEFAYPFLFSIITFGLLLKQIDVKEVTISNVIMSFQTGFFWQTLLKKEIK